MESSARPPLLVFLLSPLWVFGDPTMDDATALGEVVRVVVHVRLFDEESALDERSGIRDDSS